jgi:hypothetical protein
MAPDEYSKALAKALHDLADRVQRRDLLNAEIAGLRETVRVLCPRVKMPPDLQRELSQLLALVDYGTPSLTTAIRALLTRVSPQEMTAIEVRDRLEGSGFNFDDFSNSLSACHAALKRILAEGEIETGTPKDGKASYRRVIKANCYFEAGLGGITSLPNPFGRTLGDMLKEPQKSSATAADRWRAAVERKKK